MSPVNNSGRTVNVKLRSIAKATIKARLENIGQTRRVLAPYIRPAKPSTYLREENKKFQHFVEKKPSILMQIVTKWSMAVDLKQILAETVLALKYATISTDGIIYLMDDNMEEIFHMTENTEFEGEMKVSYKVEIGTTVAAYVATTKRCLKIDDLLEDTRFPYGLGNQDVVVKSVICVPVITSDGEVLAVFLLYRRMEYDEYTDDDFYLIIMMAAWVGSTIHQHQAQFAMKKQQELNTYLLALIHVYFYDTRVFDYLLADILNIATMCLDADHSVIYVIIKNKSQVDEDDDKIYAYVYEHGAVTINAEIYKHKITIHSDDEHCLLNHIISNKKSVNFKDCIIDHPLVNQKHLHHQKNYRIKTLLATPIMLSRDIFGILMVTNKKSVPMFLKTDESLLFKLSEYSGLAIKYIETFTQEQYFINMNKCYENTLSYSIKPCIHDQANFGNIDMFFPQRFSFFDFFLSEDIEHLAPQFVTYILRFTIDDLFLSPEEMTDFVLTIRKFYPSNPYHNFLHAFYTLHCVYTILGNVSSHFSLLQCRAMILAAFCHGMNHPGVSNTMLQIQGHYINDMYEDPLIENHSFAIFEFIVQTSKLFSRLPKEEFNELMSEIKFCIISTNISVNLPRHNQLIKLYKKRMFNVNLRTHRSLLMSLIMAVANLADFCKPFVVVKDLVTQLYAERYDEGYFYKKLGLCPINEYNKRKADSMAQQQIDFFNVIVIPYTSTLYKVLPAMKPLSHEASVVKDHWIEIRDARGQRMWTVAGSHPYKFDPEVGSFSLDAD